MSYQIPEGVMINPCMHFKRTSPMAGLHWVLIEGVRNALKEDQGNANRVDITIKQDEVLACLVLVLLDDGIGLNANARWRFGNRLAYAGKDGGNGTGIRDASLTMCQVLECYTISQEEPNVVYYIRLPIVEWFIRLACNDWHGEWQSFSRQSDRNPIPQGLTSGTLIRLSDFRRSHYEDPFNESRMMDTSAQITPKLAAGAIRRYLREFVEQVRLNDRKIKLGPLPGFKLWKPKPYQRDHLGKVQGHVCVASDPQGHVLKIGGSTSTINMDKFLEDLSQHAPELARRMPEVFTKNRQLVGSINIQALEPFSAMQRQSIMPEFFVTPNAHRVVDEMITIAASIEKGLARYAKRTSSDVTRACISSIAARLSKASGVAFVRANGGGGSESSGSPDKGSGGKSTADSHPKDDLDEQAPKPPVVEDLIISPQSVRLEQWRGEGPRDSTTVSVSNPLGDETFAWTDFSSNLLTDAYGGLITVAAPKKEGTFLCRVTSVQHPTRTADFDVHVRALPEETETDAPAPFRLVPETMNIQVGEERPIKVKHQGATSGDFVWGWTAADQGIACTAQPGNRRLMVRAAKPGKFSVICRDMHDASLTRTTIVNVRAAKQPPIPKPETDSGSPEEAGSTPDKPPKSGEDLKMHPGVIGLISLAVELDGETFSFTAEATPAITSMFYADPDNRQISIGDRMASAAALDNRQREMHVLHAIAHGVRSIMLSKGEISSSDARQHERLVDFILTEGIPKR